MFVAVAIVIGFGAGLLTIVQGLIAHVMQRLVYGFPVHLRPVGVGETRADGAAGSIAFR